jgi:hypothetical protein
MSKLKHPFLWYHWAGFLSYNHNLLRMSCPVCGKDYTQYDYDSGVHVEYGFCEEHGWFDRNTRQPEFACKECSLNGDICFDCDDRPHDNWR